MYEQYTLYDYIDEPNPNEPIKMPTYDKKILKGIKGLSDIIDKVPKYLVTFKNPVFGKPNYHKTKICIYVGWWHSLDGWNYKDEQVERWELWQN